MSETSDNNISDISSTDENHGKDVETQRKELQQMMKNFEQELSIPLEELDQQQQQQQPQRRQSQAQRRQSQRRAPIDKQQEQQVLLSSPEKQRPSSFELFQRKSILNIPLSELPPTTLAKTLSPQGN